MFLAYRNALLLAAGFLLIACGQKPGDEKPKAEIAIPKISKAELLEAKILIASGGSTSFWDAGEYIESPERLRLPEKPELSTEFRVVSAGWTNDYGQVYSDSQTEELDMMAIGFQMLSNKAIAIMTIDSSWTLKEDFDNLVQTMADEWKLDNKADGKILICISRPLNRVGIVCSNNLNERLPATEKQNIINNIMLSEFSKGNYFEGTKKGLQAVMQNVYRITDKPFKAGG
ncbi:TPM domain-containing protein [Flavobacterium sp.]|uniref:TPM domain-containing protein n=1 Tax=Flavobacterium sp. TaxID=239 RepID=UPI004034E78D